MTTLSTWPSELWSISRTMDRLIDEFFAQFGATAPASDGSTSGLPTYTLPVDILETKDAYVLTAPVAGFPPDKVEVTYDQGVLTITAKAEPLEVQGTWVRQERPFGNRVRRLQLPEQVQADRISASVENGLLTVNLPKVSSPEPVRIPIGGGSPQSS